MKDLKKIKLKELVNDSLSKVEELSEIKGGIGIALFDACYSNICNSNRDSNAKYCDGGSVCTHGIGTN